MKRILLIEDDSWLAASFARSLRAYEVSIAPTPQQAVAALDEQLPDLIISDVLLQSGNAFDVLGLLAGYGDTKNIPVILISTIMKDIAPAAEQYDVFALLDKTTVTPEQLRTTVEAACRR